MNKLTSRGNMCYPGSLNYFGYIAIGLIPIISIGILVYVIKKQKNKDKKIFFLSLISTLIILGFINFIFWLALINQANSLSLFYKTECYGDLIIPPWME